MKWRKTHIVFIDIRWLFVKIILAILLFCGVISYLKWTQVNVIQFKSEALASSWQIANLKKVKGITKALKKSSTVIGPRPNRGSITMQLISQRETKDYLLINPEVVYDCQDHQLLAVPKELVKTLQEVVANLKRKSPYGEIVKWEKVNVLLPIGGKALVTDLDTKGKFFIQRTGGYNHADMEPITTKDSLQVQALYSSKWSWKRRAVVVEVGNGKKIAASLVGMPQGKDQLKGNQCPGSLGLFFYSTAVERSNNLSHQMIIWKAAGKTYELLRKLTPEETIMTLFTSLDQGDLTTLKKIVKPLKTQDKTAIKEIIGATVTKIAKQGEENYNVTISLSLKKGPYNYPRYLSLKLTKDQEMGFYYTNRNFLDELLRIN